MLMVVASTVFSSKFLDGHIIVEVNHFDYLVDTGSPVSFGRGGSIFINGQKFLLNHSAMGVTPDSIIALSGLHMDILSKFDIRFSLNEIHFFDTSAQLSYLSNDLLTGASTGERQDFHPSIGRFTTNVNANVESLTFGSLPSSMAILLDMGRAKGIVGSELLNKYTITLSNATQNLILEPTIES